MTRLLAAVGATSALLLTSAAPVGAAPTPRPDQWWFKAWQIQQSVWPVSKGAGVTVAVIDDGVNGQLPDFQGAMVPGTDAGSATGDGQIGPTSSAEDSHGTGMAALIASRGTDSGFVGVAPESKIMPIKSHLGVWDVAIRYAVDHGAKVINISQGFPGKCKPDVQEAVSYALQKDAVIVVSAGNDGNGLNQPHEPASCSGVLAVGAIDNQKVPWERTQRQPYVAVAAPGLLVNTLRADGQVIDRRAGTSQAAALTSAVVALVRSKHPNMPAREVVQRVINTATDVGPPGKDNMTGYGVVMPAAAMTSNVPKDAPNPVFAAHDKWLAANPQASTQPSPTASEVVKSDATKAAEEANRNTVFLLVGAAAVVLVAGLIVFFLVRRGKKKGRGGPGAGPPGGMQSGPPPGWGGQAPPPPQGGTPVPPQGGQPGPPPGWGGPPQGPSQGGPPYVPPQGPVGPPPPN